MTSSGQSHFFSDELWTSSTYLSDKLWTSSQKLNDELWTQSRFFSAINCEEFEIKAKIRVENELFTFFTMPIVFLSHFYMIYVETAFHVTVPLRGENIDLPLVPSDEACEPILLSPNFPRQVVFVNL